MGMAASQARYLALVARKSNCEYEGQQINQARTALSNQSANLFNQMLGLQVPIPPSTQDFTKTQYSFKDGENSSTISSWQQLATPEEDYNYVVTHHYYTNVFTGSEKKLSDPQVQMNDSTATLFDIQSLRSAVATAEAALAQATQANKEAEAAYQQAVKDLSVAKSTASTLDNYATVHSGLKACAYDEANSRYTVTNADNSTTTYVSYDSLTGTNKAAADTMINSLVTNGALSENYADSKEGLFFTQDGSNFVRQNDLALLYLGMQTPGTTGSLKSYNAANASAYANDVETKNSILELAQLNYKGVDGNGGTFAALGTAQAEYDNALEAYNNANHPEYLGNCALTPLGTLNDNQKADLEQIIKDLTKDGNLSNLSDCFDDDGNYLGGVYQFKLNGTTYYTTYNDMYDSYASGTGINNIDGQTKLAYYHADYVSTKVEETQKALLETDGTGRFVSVRLEDDSVTYTLTMETVTDENAYNDAMNQYYYENAKYDKMIQDINAKTSIIQREDQQLELRLKQLDTEQNALSTEIDAVSKIVKDNVESSFKTFGG